MIYDLIAIGGGAGGFYTSIRLAEFYPGAKICILEAGRKPLSKVEISGGGRCNVTHACFDPAELVTFYPRGQKEMLGPFYHFQPGDLIEWFRSKGVKLKTEADGRVFPVTDKSSTIIDCFMKLADQYGIQLYNSTRASKWRYNQPEKTWDVELIDGQILRSRFLLISAGSDQRTWKELEHSGHHIIRPVPSLFTFNIQDKNLQSLQGISSGDARVSIPGFKLETNGPILITHWGLSGPAILKLSAWGARDLYEIGYIFDVFVNWIHADPNEIRQSILSWKKEFPKRHLSNIEMKHIPSRLWKYLCSRAGLPQELTPADMSNKQLDLLIEAICNDKYRVTGKSTFKEEFVTAGGVDLKNLDMRRFESKLCPGLFLVGEVLNIDALTGGFNFQAAWTGAFLAATAMSERMHQVS